MLSAVGTLSKINLIRPRAVVFDLPHKVYRLVAFLGLRLTGPHSLGLTRLIRKYDVQFGDLAGTYEFGFTAGDNAQVRFSPQSRHRAARSRCLARADSVEEVRERTGKVLRISPPRHVGEISSLPMPSGAAPTAAVPGGVNACLRRTGHILGAASIQLDGDGTTIVFSGEATGKVPSGRFQPLTKP